ncbi:MAG: 30S ribosomal protein S8e [Candidatus Bathyarchaeia archaeon]
MTVWHGDLHKRKKTGGRKRPYRGKRAFERGSPPTETRIGERKLKVVKGRGGVLKYRLFSGKMVNVVDPNTGKAEKAEIKKVVENRANREFQKRGVITKGAVVETTSGKVKVTSRPGQHGVINGVLIERA